MGLWGVVSSPLRATTGLLALLVGQHPSALLAASPLLPPPSPPPPLPARLPAPSFSQPPPPLGSVSDPLSTSSPSSRQLPDCLETPPRPRTFRSPSRDKRGSRNKTLLPEDPLLQKMTSCGSPAAHMDCSHAHLPLWPGVEPETQHFQQTLKLVLGWSEVHTGQEEDPALCHVAFLKDSSGLSQGLHVLPTHPLWVAGLARPPPLKAIGAVVALETLVLGDSTRVPLAGQPGNPPWESSPGVLPLTGTTFPLHLSHPVPLDSSRCCPQDHRKRAF